jgi:glycosyltransferase involved in cell wall biosynthesis
LARKHPLVRVLPNEKNLGCNASMNRAMAQAKGDWVLFTAADDEVRPGVFEHHTRMVRAHPEAGISSGISEYRDTVSGLTWYNGGGMPKEACFLSPVEMVSFCKRSRLAINNQSALYKKSALTEAGGWIPELHWFSDVFADAVVGFRYGMCHVPEVLSNFYLYPGSYYSSKARAHGERRAVMHQMLDLLGEARFADVAPLVRRSGFMGSFGWSIVRVALSRPSHWKFLTPAFLFLASKRSAEIFGRRFFPQWLAQVCVEVFYGR